ncbi:carbohydrate ABC transporter permease [Ferrimicrobium acidiphilum]|uniref:Lactose transport system permease protein LacF n=2 Tax=Ferrimicrobium acidiphilum TaxID=121039 RepID=A0A0D8FTC0_9ACTN|nr:sugar ABC transporter permease [Ferrimicrobium acidiphilum]KJE76525.1 lactose transport system permease protein LacF [Ferrimicrobium acidiphilum DSM 19497]MCL5052683.1 sugar ABC transporter permease [Gammaproteobacteria bacterium]
MTVLTTSKTPAAASPQRSGRGPLRLFKPSRRARDARIGFAMTLPGVAILFLFTLGPALYAFYLSLFSWSLLNHMHYVGLSNFGFLFTSHLFWTAVVNTVTFALVVVPTQTIVALCIAVLLNQNLPAKGFFRLAFFFPAVSSSAVISIIFMWIYNKFGILNGFLSIIGIHGPNWLANPLFALKAIMIMNIWTTSGYFMVVFLSGLQAIPQNIYDASQMDGASVWQRFIHITVPLLRPTTFFVVIMGMIGTLQMFDQSFILSGGTGGPLHSTTTIVLLIYQYIFSYGKVGYGAAATVLLFVLTMGITLVVTKWLGKPIEY